MSGGAHGQHRWGLGGRRHRRCVEGEVLVVVGLHAGVEEQAGVGLRRGRGAAVVGLAGELARELVGAGPAVRVGVLLLLVLLLVLRYELRVGEALGAGRVGGHVVGVAADEGGDAAEEVIALFPGALGGDAVAGHLVEPVDGLLGRGEDVLGLLGHVVRTHEEFEDEDRGRLGHVVRQAPPGCHLVQADRVGLVRDEIEHAARTGHTQGGGCAVEVLGLVRLVGDAPVDAAEAGAVDDDLRAVEAEAEAHALADELLVALLLGEVEDGGERRSPSLELVVERGDVELDLRPRFGHGDRSVELCEDVVCDGAQVGGESKVKGKSRWCIFE